MSSQTTFIVRQSAIYGIGNTLAKLSGALLLPLYMAFTSEAEFGLIALFETIAQFLLAISALGAKAGLSRYYYECTDRGRRQFFAASLAFITASSGVFCLLGLWAMTTWSVEIFRIPISPATFVLFSVAVFGLLMAEVPYIALRLQQKARQQTVHRCVNVLMTIALTFVFLRVMHWGVEGIFAAQAAANMLTLIGLMPCMVRNCAAPPDVRTLGESIRYGIPLALSNVVTIVLTLSDRHILNQLRSIEEVGGYSLAYKIANIIQMIVVTSFITSYTYFYYKSLHDPGLHRTNRNIFRLFVIAMSVIGFGLVAFRREAVWVVSLGREAYQDSAMLIPYLVVGLLVSGIRQMLTLPLTKLKLTRSISAVSVLIALTNIVLNFALIPAMGKLGASLTTGMAQALGCAVFYLMLRRRGEADFDMAVVFKCLGAFAAFAALASAVQFDSVAGNVAWGAALMAGFGGSLFALRVVSPADIREAIAQIRRPRQ